MSHTFRPAVRSNAKPLIALFGPSGSGKTMSALLLARGFVGPNGKIGVIDTERGRSELYATVIPGGFDVSLLTEPFSPKAYAAKLQEAETAGLDALVIDSFSHEWEGAGGVLEMAMESGQKGLLAWKDPKMQHQRLVLRLLQTPLFVIVCLRAQYKSRMIGKDIIRDEHATAIQDSKFLFELTVNCELRPDHKMRVTKNTPGLETVFRDNDTISIQTGERLAEWARGGSPNAATAAPAAPAPASSKEGQDGAGVTLSQRARDAAMKGYRSYETFFLALTDKEQARLWDTGEHEHNITVGRSFDRDMADDPRMKERA